MFPVDTIKTLMQVRGTNAQLLSADGSAAAYRGGMSVVAGHLHSQGGMLRMWRGVQTMFSGCIPAHAAYFSTYEGVKARLSTPMPAGLGSSSSSSSSSVTDAGASSSVNDTMAAGVAVALGTMLHDAIMAPMDCIKQRLQLGHYGNSVVDCACDIIRKEGLSGLLRAYPTTLLMNMPYALIMGSTNEALRELLNPSGEHSVGTYVAAGAGSGMVAAAVTNPLDVVKTRLQTQHLCLAPAPDVCPPTVSSRARSAGPSCPRAAAAECPRAPVAYTGMIQAARALLTEEGPRVFARGMKARVLIHAPSVAICWTTYESVKHMFGRLHLFE